MAWHIVGTYYAPCSCKVGCPCILGEMEGDQVWCSGGQWVHIGSGDVDGVDVGGAKLAWVADWPKGFLGGEGVGRIYFDPSVSAAQRATLEPLFKGQRGGVYEVVTREVEVECLPADIPTEFKMDVSGLMLNQSLRAGELAFDKAKIKLLTEVNAVLAHVVALRVEEEKPVEAVAAEAATPAEPEVIKKGKKEAEEGEEGAEAEEKPEKPAKK